MSRRVRAGSILQFVPLQEQRRQHIKHTAREEHKLQKEILLRYISSHIPEEALVLNLSPELRVVRCAKFFLDSLTMVGQEVFDTEADREKNVITHLYLYYEFTTVLFEQFHKTQNGESVLAPSCKEEAVKIANSFFSLFLLYIEKRNLFLRSKEQAPT